MTGGLRVSLGAASAAGRKPVNQDFHGAQLPEGTLRASKGVALAVADGIGTSAVSHRASETAVHGFLDDYFCTAESWSVKTSGQRVLAALNAWLHAQSRREPGGGIGEARDRGWVCTFAALVLKSTTAHLFHVGDSRIARRVGQGLEPLTQDHRVMLGAGESYLGRALGADAQVEIDYRAVGVERGDLFVMSTDGVHDHVDARFVCAAVDAAGDLDVAAEAIVQEALRRGSDDNLTVQLLRVDHLPDGEAAEWQQQARSLPLPPLPQPRTSFDGWRILRELHASHRSHAFLAQDEASGLRAVLKIPAIDLRADAELLDRFLLEDWVARRIASAHVLRPVTRERPIAWLYTATEYIEGQTLAQWMTDHPRPSLEEVRGIVEQIARGLHAFHRREMLHQDLRPENVMIDREGTVRIIDFGAVHVAGLADQAPPAQGGREARVLGAVQYAAPECFLGEVGTPRSDQFSLGVIAYQMLTGRLPYGADVARTRTRVQQARLHYRPAGSDEGPVPAWVDEALARAVHPLPERRYETISEFLVDLRRPNPAFFRRREAPLIERHPLRFWQGLSLLLGILVLALLWRLAGGG